MIPGEDNELLDSERLARDEAALWTDEQAAEARAELVRRRRRAIAELHAYVEDRELALRARAGRVGLSLHDLGLDGGLEAPRDLAEEAAASAERQAVLVARAELVARRAAAVAERRRQLERGLAEELRREERLVARDNALTEAYRALVLRSASSGGVSTDGRRLHPRIELRVPVDLASEHHFTASAETGNVSAGGLFVATRDVLALGRVVRAVVRLPDEGELAVDGVVAWRRTAEDAEGPAGFGLRFTGVPETARLAIDRFLARRGSGFAGPGRS